MFLNKSDVTTVSHTYAVEVGYNSFITIIETPTSYRSHQVVGCEFEYNGTKIVLESESFTNMDCALDYINDTITDQFCK